MEKFRRGKSCFFRVIFDGFVFILFHEFKWYFHPVFVLFLCSFDRFLYCFQTTLRLFSYNFILLLHFCILFTAVLPKRLYKTWSHHGLIKRARQTPSLLTLSPFLLFLDWRSPLPFYLCFYLHLLNFLGYARGISISFCNLGFIGCHVFDIRSGHIHFQGQYSLYFFPFVCSIFLVVFFALVVFVFNAFLVITFLQPLPGFQSYKGV